MLDLLLYNMNRNKNVNIHEDREFYQVLKKTHLTFKKVEKKS